MIHLKIAAYYSQNPHSRWFTMLFVAFSPSKHWYDVFTLYGDREGVSAIWEMDYDWTIANLYIIWKGWNM